MRIAVAGAGAMGCRFGWMLHRAGHDVVLVDGWAEQVAAINQRGLTVDDEDGRHVAVLPALRFGARGLGVPAADLVIVFGKAMQTERIAADSLPLFGPRTWVITLQNGHGNIEVLQRHVAAGRLLAGVTTLATELLGPGHIRALGSGETLLGPVHGDATAAAELVAVAAALDGAGLRVTVTADVLPGVWTKVAFNAVLNPLCALLSVPVGGLAAYPAQALGEMVAGIVDEAVAVAAAEGVRLDRERVIGLINEQFDPAMAGHHRPSMLQDLLNGRATEIGHLNGEIARRGARHGIPTPHNWLLLHLVRMLAATRPWRVATVAGGGEPGPQPDPRGEPSRTVGPWEGERET